MLHLLQRPIGNDKRRAAFNTCSMKRINTQTFGGHPLFQSLLTTPISRSFRPIVGLALLSRSPDSIYHYFLLVLLLPKTFYSPHAPALLRHQHWFIVLFSEVWHVKLLTSCLPLPWIDQQSRQKTRLLAHHKIVLRCRHKPRDPPFVLRAELIPYHRSRLKKRPNQQMHYDFWCL